MIAAMQRQDAGQLHTLAGRPGNLIFGAFPWRIQVTEAPEVSLISALQEEHREPMPEGTEEALSRALGFAYPHMEATRTPSKQTATERKGRRKDEEAAEETPEPKHIVRAWRKPSFLEESRGGKDYGSALHAAMHYIRYENCCGKGEVQQEIAWLVQQGLLSPEQGELVNCARIAAFFDTEIGRKLRSGVHHLREFKFSILDDADGYGENLSGEQVLLQGVVDCALLEEDGITVLDFKTDRVTEDTLEATVRRYAPQVQTYADALSRIYEMDVKGKYLYFFRLNRFVEI